MTCGDAGRRRAAIAAIVCGLGLVLGLGACHGARPARPTPGSGGTTSGARPPAGTVGSVQLGMATWYATGTMTASGERFDKGALTAAHRTLPFGTIVRVTHRKSHKRVDVRINDRGPFGSKRRIIDVSEAAARRLGIIDEGVAPVRVEVLRRGSGKRRR